MLLLSVVIGVCNLQNVHHTCTQADSFFTAAVMEILMCCEKKTRFVYIHASSLGKQDLAWHLHELYGLKKGMR